MDFLTLDWRGAMLAILFAVAFLLLGLLEFGFFFAFVMIVFLVLSAIVTRIGMDYKKSHGLGQETRSINNVLANGLPPLIMVLLFFVFINLGKPTVSLLFVMGFFGSVAAITADKFNSEIGVLNGKPRMLFSFKQVRKGTSGGITLLGTMAGLIAALIIALLVVFVANNITALGGYYAFGLSKAIVSIIVGGLFGGFVDSILGKYEEGGLGNKFTSNFICGIAGGLMAILIFVIL